MTGSVSANYKTLQRFLHRVDVKAHLLRLLPTDAPYVIGDPTEIARPQAYKTEYVGKLKDRKTRGFWLLLLATPYRGRALPCGFVTYSSRTISQQQRSRNQYHWEAFEPLKAILGSRPLVLDREFSYLELMQALILEQVNFVIRLKVGAHFFDQEGKQVILSVKKGETRILNKVLYMGKVFVNVIGQWKEGLHEPLWIMTNLPAEQGLEFYLQRMKIDESFRDLKSLLGMDKLMCQKRHWMEQMVCLALIAYAIGLVLGETLRSHLFPKTSRKWKLYSGLFVLLKLKLGLPFPEFKLVSHLALQTFHALLIPVRTPV
jgi:hypothetical protein